MGTRWSVSAPVSKISELRYKPSVVTRECPECLSGIPVAARRCSFCTSVVGPAA